MSKIFFDELFIPRADYHLGVGSGSHGEQTGALLPKIERVLSKEKPRWVIVYGDTNSTLAGALAAAKLHIPVAHVEAGLRSYDKTMPEEINRVITDHVSALLFCPTKTAVTNLKKEGITKGVFQVGDVMYDAFLQNRERISTSNKTLREIPRPYALLTIHRASNTDSPDPLRRILAGLSHVPMTIFFPVHPRTKKAIRQFKLAVPENVVMVHPRGYLEMLRLEKQAALILTDSGGVQKEAYFARVPCITFRDQTEWKETVQNGWNQLVGSSPALLSRAIQKARRRPTNYPMSYGDGRTATRISQILRKHAR
jgi:UDP-N-acetylglucosamine 2-epimerase